MIFGEMHSETQCFLRTARAPCSDAASFDRSVRVSAGSKYQPPSINEINNFDQKPNSRETGKGSKQDWPLSESVCEYILSPFCFVSVSSASLWNHQLVDFVISALASLPASG
jgi:hypothetical protein